MIIEDLDPAWRKKYEYSEEISLHFTFWLYSIHILKTHTHLEYIKTIVQPGIWRKTIKSKAKS